MTNNTETTDPAGKSNAPAEEEDNEDIIDLTEIVENPEEDDDVIELTDIVKQDVERAAGETIPDEAGPSAREDDEASPGEPTSDGDVAPGVVEADGAAPDEAPLAAVSPGQVEAAVEKVVRDLYAEKIEPILYDVVKMVVKDEIDKLKNILDREVPPDD